MRDRLLALCRQRAGRRRRGLRQLQRPARRTPAPGAARHARLPHRRARPSRASASRRPGRCCASWSRARRRARARRADARPGRAPARRAPTRACCTTSWPRSTSAVYFHEFAAHAARHELQYLAEADFFEMQIGAASEPAARRAARDGGPGAPRAVPGLPQGPDVPPDAAVPRRAGDRPHAAPRGRSSASRSPPRRSPAASAAPTALTFEGPTGSTLTTDHPLVIEALERAARAWPAAVWVARAARAAPDAGAHRAVRRAAAQLRRQRRRAPRPPAAR